MPSPGSKRGYNPSAYIVPLMLMMLGGGSCIEHIREIKNDDALINLLNLRIPSLINLRRLATETRKKRA